MIPGRGSATPSAPFVVRDGKSLVGQLGAGRLRVAMDATPLLGARTGIGRMTARFVTELATDPGLELVAFAVTWRGRDTLRAQLPTGVRAATRPIPARLVREAWRHLEFPRVEQWTGAVDVVHATNFVAPPTRRPTLVSVADLSFIVHPETCTPDTRAYDGLIRRALRRGAHVHAISDAMRDEILDHFDLPPARVHRIYPGVDVPPPGDAARGRHLAGRARYIVAIGTIEPRKDYPALVRAFDLLAADDPDIGLVVVGQAGWDNGAFEAEVARARAGDRIRVTGFVDEVDRNDLLAGAGTLAYPSRYEGFGFPPLEAMAAGIPVVATDAGSLPEVLGDAASLVAVGAVDELAAAIRRVLDDEVWAAELIARGRRRVLRYSWSESARALGALYREIAA